MTASALSLLFFASFRMANRGEQFSLAFAEAA